MSEAQTDLHVLSTATLSAAIEFGHQGQHLLPYQGCQGEQELTNVAEFASF